MTNQKQNIRVLHTEWSDGWGGQEVRILSEMLAMRERGIEVYMACTSHSMINQKAREHNIPTFNLAFKGNWDVKTLRGLMKIIKNEKIDSINTHSSKDTWIGGIAAKLCKIKFIRTRHLSILINPSWWNCINSLADFVITTGESIRQNMIHRNRIKADRILSIPTGVDELRFDPSKFDRAAERQQFGIADDEIAIGIVAILRGFKRHDHFIEMAQRVKASNPDKKLKFIIAGNGPREAQIQQLSADANMKDDIHMIGYQEKPEHILSALDIFTLTSDAFEGVPQSVMQALMMSKCVVATNAGSTCDLHHDDNYVVAEAGDVDDITDNIDHLIKDAELREYYANRSRDYVVANFSKKCMADKCMGIYQQLLST